MPWARLPNRKLSPTETCTAPRRSIRTSRTNSSAVSEAKPVVERDHDELLDAQPGDQVALDIEGADQLGRRLGVDDRQRVRVEGEHRVGAPDHLAMPEMDTVEGADGDPARPRARLDVWKRGDPHAGANTTTGRTSPARESPIASSSPSCVSRISPVALSSPRMRLPLRMAAASSPDRTSSGMKASASRRGTRIARRQRVLQPERADRRSLELVAVGVAQVRYERAHVRAGGALDLERGAVVLVPEQLRPVDRDRARPSARGSRPPARARRRASLPPSPPSRPAASGAAGPPGSRATPASGPSRRARRRGRPWSTSTRAAPPPGTSSAGP